MLVLQPTTQREAFAFIARHHRHHRPPQGHLFAMACHDGERVVGVVVVARPVARLFDDGWTAEITRLCTINHAPMGAASKLYSAGKRAAQALGYKRVITYILATEDGASLRAAGWRPLGVAGGGTWNRPARFRIDTHPLEQKQLWEAA